MIHIGKLIKAEVYKQKIPISWFAQKLYCDRTNIYKIFNRQSIDSELLLRISKILKYDFFLYYQKELSDRY